MQQTNNCNKMVLKNTDNIKLMNWWYAGDESKHRSC